MREVVVFCTKCKSTNVTNQKVEDKFGDDPHRVSIDDFTRDPERYEEVMEEKWSMSCGDCGYEKEYWRKEKTECSGTN